MITTDIEHKSVLLNEVLEYLNPKEGEVYIDMTINGGGHSSKIAPCLGKKGVLVGIDQDPSALTRAKKRIGKCEAKIHLMEDNFRNIKAICKKLGISRADKVLFDLGLSTHELEVSGRGFSFQKDEPLLMTFSADPLKVAFTASDIVNTWAKGNIAAVIEGYGEERFARKIAESIVTAREKKKIETTKELVEIIEAGVPPRFRRGKTHFATKTFQALRIAVNDEIRALEEALKAIWILLSPHGRIAVISFHSAEDRIVKRFFRNKQNEGSGKLLFKKAITPGDEELAENRRARSAKLRIIEKF
jgi:16S rRNA (cytosine1402-N4)-methyltransferase